MGDGGLLIVQATMASKKYTARDMLAEEELAELLLDPAKLAEVLEKRPPVPRKSKRQSRNTRSNYSTRTRENGGNKTQEGWHGGEKPQDERHSDAGSDRPQTAAQPKQNMRELHPKMFPKPRPVIQSVDLSQLD